jgi:hypothetical protein
VQCVECRDGRTHYTSDNEWDVCSVGAGLGSELNEGRVVVVCAYMDVWKRERERVVSIEMLT